MSATRRRVVGSALEIGATAAIAAAVAAISIQLESFYFPPFPEVLDSFSANWLFERVGSDLMPSLSRIFKGFGLAIAIGVPLGLILGLSKSASEYTQPIVDFMRALPPPILIPFGILVLGLGDTMKVSLIAFVCVFPILMNTVDGVRNLDPMLLESARVYRTRGIDRVLRIILPGALPQIFAGLRISLTLSLLLVVLSELVASEDGVGNYIKESGGAFDMPGLWSGILLLGLLGYVFNAVFVLIERRALVWHRGSRRSALN